MKVQLDKIGSVTLHADLPREVELSDRLEPTEGLVVVVKALQDKAVYDQLELVNGRQAKMSRDDIIAGALGRRRALHGFVGEMPETLAVGDRVHVLNLGGVIGVCISGSPIVKWYRRCRSLTPLLGPLLQRFVVARELLNRRLDQLLEFGIHVLLTGQTDQPAEAEHRRDRETARQRENHQPARHHAASFISQSSRTND